jgi:hypothetical protein
VHEPRWPERVYRSLLRLFPGEFQGEFGEQMKGDFRDQCAEVAGVGGTARLCRRTAVDLLRRAPLEHLDILRRDAGYTLRLFGRHPGTSLSVLLTLAVGIGLTAAVFTVAYGRCPVTPCGRQGSRLHPPEMPPWSPPGFVVAAPFS